jgi:hypothetical protein
VALLAGLVVSVGAVVKWVTHEPISPAEPLVTAGGTLIKQKPMIDYRGPGA